MRPVADFVAGDTQAISPSAHTGLKHFIGEGGCLTVSLWALDTHTMAYHSIGVSRTTDGGALKDSGRAGAIDKLNPDQFIAGGKHSDDPNGIRATIDT